MEASKRHHAAASADLATKKVMRARPEKAGPPQQDLGHSAFARHRTGRTHQHTQRSSSSSSAKTSDQGHLGTPQGREGWAKRTGAEMATEGLFNKLKESFRGQWAPAKPNHKTPLEYFGFSEKELPSW